MRLLYLLASLSAVASALPSLLPAQSKPKPKPLPLLIWHGLGDRFDADGLQSTGELAQEVNPGTFVYYIRTDEDGGSDRTNTFFGNVTSQLAEVCATIHDEPGLAHPDDRTKVRADALGFSQGGQFLRALVEACEGLEVRSLVTFGSQHNGISEFQECGDFDFLCKGATGLITNNVWTDFIQGKVVPAQYYREVNETTGLGSDEYLKKSNFLAHINNEKEIKVERYKEKIAALEKFVMYVFEEDVTVIPRETGWFADVNITSGEVTPLRERKLYKEDWLGLKKLDEKGGLVFRNTTGKHMELSDKDLRDAFLQYFGPEHDADDDRVWEEVFTPYRKYEQAATYSYEAEAAGDEEQANMWMNEANRILEQIQLIDYDNGDYNRPEGKRRKIVQEIIDEDVPGYKEWMNAICKSAHAEDAKERQMWLGEANRIIDDMRANGYELMKQVTMDVVDGESRENEWLYIDDYVFDQDGNWPEEDYVFEESEEWPEDGLLFAEEDYYENYPAYDVSNSSPEIEDAEWDDIGAECASDRAQAAWDAMSWWRKRKFEWYAVWLPWWRGELTKLSDVEREDGLTPHEQLK